jgi:hypothetical protein
VGICLPRDASAPYCVCLAEKTGRFSATAREFMSWSAWVACGTANSSDRGIHCVSTACPSWKIGVVSLPTTTSTGSRGRVASWGVKHHCCNSDSSTWKKVSISAAANRDPLGPQRSGTADASTGQRALQSWSAPLAALGGAGGRTAVYLIAGGNDAEQARAGNFTNHNTRYRRPQEYVTLLKRTWANRRRLITRANATGSSGRMQTFAASKCRICPSTVAVVPLPCWPLWPPSLTCTCYGESRSRRPPPLWRE